MGVTNTINLDAVIDAMYGAGKQVKEAVARALQREAVNQAPEDTGYLKSSIIVQEEPGTGLIQVVVVADYAEYVEFGFVHWVSHKYIPPNPFFRRAIEIVAVRFPEIVSDAGISIPALFASHKAGVGRPTGSYAGLPTTDAVYVGITFN